MKQHTTNHFVKSKKLIMVFCLLAIISLGFWACRKQDYKADALQITSTQLKLGYYLTAAYISMVTY